uniref:Major facilitator superfamily domain containing 4Ab n=1 Tax=Cyprinus carpio TaxID=7962 RepID=A0A8C1W793_CYPCA
KHAMHIFILINRAALLLTSCQTHENPSCFPCVLRLFRALIALFFSSLIISVVFAIIPLCYNVLLLAVAMAVSGLAMGIIDTIANIQLVSIYKKDSAIFLQALHFFIGLGVLVSPLIVDPFISEHCLGSNSTENATEVIHHFRSSFRSPVIHTENSPHSELVEEKASVVYAFWIMTLINVRCATTVLVTTAPVLTFEKDFLRKVFLVCGFVIGCLCFVFFLSMILCNRIHRNLTGKNNKLTWL